MAASTPGPSSPAKGCEEVRGFCIPVAGRVVGEWRLPPATDRQAAQNRFSAQPTASTTRQPRTHLVEETPWITSKSSRPGKRSRRPRAVSPCPRSEDEYEQLFGLREHLSEHYDAKREPYTSFLQLALSYAVWWVETRALAIERGSWHLTREAEAELLNTSSDYVDKLVTRGDLTLTDTPEGPRLDLVAVRANHHARNNHQGMGLRRIIGISEEVGAYDAEHRKRGP